MSGMLPGGFESLEPFVATWAIDGANARADQRGAAPAQACVAFYAAAKDLLIPALDYLDARPLQSHDEREKRLMQLMLSLAHVSLTQEVQGDDEPRHAGFRAHMPITRAPADARAAR